MFHEKCASSYNLCIDRRLLESDAQNRQLIEISSKKEEILHQLQCKEQKLMEDVAALNRQLDMTMADSRRQNDEQREKSIAKDRANLSRVTDLEAQLARCNTQVSHLKKNKEEVQSGCTCVTTNLILHGFNRLNEDSTLVFVTCKISWIKYRQPRRVSKIIFPS